MNKFNIKSAVATPTNLGQCSIAAARKKRFWRTCNSAFLAIHLFALAIVGFILGDGWLFRVVAASIVVGPVLAFLAHSEDAAEAKEVAHG